ncbi:ferredoxin reductase family protein [Dactylosporangium matsuzakiense]|uniref:Oxidoreductase n=1 Tax=Dactylosporangium matsuzakiense TaxID=53360 RepID=A0A9W6NPD6_9ACTN|nr:ferredoxin reductase family protein [Dactylosporangium matsuzakiense]UWZ42898.1 ferredoxin reductase family protein [Dactylosporangium matsuzakiense]GLL03972.1 oxidoreductase [Dactylosporangium matsuzakiense]
MNPLPRRSASSPPAAAGAAIPDRGSTLSVLDGALPPVRTPDPRAAVSERVRSHRRPRGGTGPQRASFALLAVAIANAVVVEALFFTASDAPNLMLAAGRFLGLHAAVVLALQLVLVARVPWLDRRLGMGQLTVWHRWVGITLAWTIIVHATLASWAYARINNWPFDTLKDKWLGSLGTLAGIVSGTVLLVVVLASTRFMRRRLPYELWHAVHLGTYAVVAFAIVHQTIENPISQPATWAKAYWWALWTVAIGLFVFGRLLLPLYRNLRHNLRVSDVVAESEDVTSVYVTGRDLAKMPLDAGQFFLWRFLTPARWWQVNPWSLSKAPDGQSLRLTAKAVGGGSAALRKLRVGTRVFVEGPYGAFTSKHRMKSNSLLIAGGVGITPIRSLMESLDGNIVVLYRARSEADAPLLSELRHLAVSRRAKLQLVTGRTRDTQPAPLSAEHLLAAVPDIKQRDVYVCGPTAMTNAVLAALRQIGVPKTQMHAEVFAMAD